MSDESGGSDPEQNTPGHPAHQPPRVLLVDGDASSVGAARRLLEKLGYAVTVCLASTDALVLIHTPSEHFDCIIADLAMPEVSGLDLANTTRLCKPGTPFVLACGNRTALSTDFLRNCGVAAFIVKPFSAESVAGVLQRALGGRHT